MKGVNEVKGLVRSEIRKLVSIRSTYLLLIATVALAIVTVLDPDDSAATFAKPFDEQTFVFFTSLLVRILVLVLGVRAITDEFRHGTIVPTLLVCPRRNQMYAAKALVVATAGALFAVTAWGAMVGAASAVAASEGASLSLGAEAWRSLGGTALGGAAWGLIGLGLGSILRSQLVATVGGLVWLMGLEDAVRSWLGDAGIYLPGQAGLSLALGSTPRAVLVGAATLAAYVMVSLAGARLALKRDIS